MNRIATFLAIATAALTLVSAAVPTIDHADAKKQTKQQRCLTKGKTVVRKGPNRLYEIKKGYSEYYFVCSAKLGVHIPVAEIEGDTGGLPWATFAGNYVAIEDIQFSELDGEATGAMSVYDLRTGRKLGSAPIVGAGVYADNMGARPLLLRDGRLAWIGTAREGDKRVIEVRKLVGGVATTLDSGPLIDLDSLDFDDGLLGWENGDVAHAEEL